MNALEDDGIEERVEILSCHEVILTSQGNEDAFVETQWQIDKRGRELVMIQTQDPFRSKIGSWQESLLIVMHCMLSLNIERRMVTIIINMIDYVNIFDS